MTTPVHIRAQPAIDRMIEVALEAAVALATE